VKKAADISTPRAIWPLLSLNFFMADMQAGIGPFLGVFLIAMRMAEKQGNWLVLLISFIALPLRGVIAACVISKWGVYPVQMLDGIGAGLQRVAVPGLVARILEGTGRVNVGRGAVKTLQGLGASLSPAIGGWIGRADRLQRHVWLGFAATLKPACARHQAANTSPVAALAGAR